MKRNIFNLSFLLIVISSHLFSEEEMYAYCKSMNSSDDNPNMPLEILSTDASSYVNNSVDAISGSYHETALDLVVAGPEALTFQRNYVSSYDGLGALSYGWNINNFGQVQFSSTRSTDKESQALVWEHGGAYGFYTGKFSKKSSEPEVHKIHHSSICRHVTNSTSELSGANDVRNNTLYTLSKKDEVTLTTGNGTVRHYFFLNIFSNAAFMDKETYPSKNSTKYEYSESRSHFFDLKTVTLQNKHQQKLSSLHFTYNEWKSVCLKTSDNQKIDYTLKEYRNKKNKHPKPFLEKVEWPDGRYVQYQYSNRDDDHLEQLTRKNLPNNRYLINEYYRKGKNTVHGKSIELKSKDPRIMRVACQKAPVGADERPITIYSFLYKVESKTENGQVVPQAGTTTVFDAYNNKTEYDYTFDQRLATIRKYNGAALYSVEELYWGRHETEEQTNLMFRLLQKPNGDIILGRGFKYDKLGNIIEEKLAGNLTGTGDGKVNLLPDGRFIGECYTKKYTYDKTSIQSIDDGKKIILHTYDPSTRLLKSTFTIVQSNIITREFYQYDNNACICEKTLDDGSSKDKNNLAGVSERHITRIRNTTKAPYGLPEVVEEYFYDLSSGKEVLLERIVNTYTTQGRLIRQEKYDADGDFAYSIEKDYDYAGHVIREKNPVGHEVLKSYDLNGNLISQIGPHFNYHKEFSYDFMNRLIREEEYDSNGEQRVLSYRYDYRGNKIASIDQYGNETLFYYDPFNRLVKTIAPQVLVDNEIKRSEIISTYDELGREIMRTDSKGNITQTLYTHHNKPYFKKYADGFFEHLEYELNGTLKKSITANGTYVLYFYDALDRQVKKETYSQDNTLLQTESATYNAFHKICETDANGNTIYYEYDGAGRPLRTIKNHSITQYTYDALGREAASIDYIDDANWIATLHEYDHLNRVTEERKEDNNGNILTLERYEYDTHEKPVKIIQYNDLGENTTQIEYNSKGEITSTTDPLGNKTYIVYRYDYVNTIGQYVPCIETTDPLGVTRIIVNDAMNRKSLELTRDPMGNIIQELSYTYDLNGNMIRQELNGTNKVINEWSYDVMNRLTASYEGVGTTEFKVTKIAYNSYGQKSQTVKPDGVMIRYLYDPLGRLSEFFSSDNTVHYVYHYDQLDNPIEVQDLIQNTTTVRKYNSSNQVIEEKLGNGLMISYHYDALQRPIYTTLPDNTSIEYEYNALFLETVNRIGIDGKRIYSHKYVKYDQSGNLQKSKLIGNCGYIDFDIDSLGRTTSIMHPLWSSTIDRFDEVGRVVTKSIKDNVSTSFSNYEYDYLSQLTYESGAFEHTYRYDALYNRTAKDEYLYDLNAINQITFDGVNTYSFDLNGNLSSRKSNGSEVHYTYDALDRLIAIHTDQETKLFCYDELNRRISKTIQSPTLTKTYRYLYQDQNEIGSVNETGSIEELRVLGIGKGAEIGAAIAIELQGTVYAPIHDLHGNVACLLSMANEVFETYRFTAYGEEEVSSNVMNPWRFSSKRTEDGLVYFGRRFYDPQIGKWLTPDPIGYEAGPNLYAYVRNDPLGHVDQYGLYEEPGKWDDVSARESILDKVVGTIQSGIREVDKKIKKVVEYFRSEPKVKFSNTLLESSLNAQDPFIFSYGEIVSPHVQLVYTNGINTSYNDAFLNTKAISEMAGGMKVICVYNPTEGAVSDVCRSGFSLYGHFASKTVPLLHQVCDEYFANSNENSIIGMIGHSEGCINVRNAQMCYDVNLRKRIEILAVAPGGYTSKKLCRNVQHIVSFRDFVPFFDIFGIMQNYDRISFITPKKGAPLHDHALLSPSYKPPIQSFIDRLFEHDN